MRKNGTFLNCLNCGKIFYERLSKIERGVKYCSSKCYRTFRNANFVSKAFTAKCLVCNIVFKAKPGNSPKYCSKICYGKTLINRKTPGDKHFNWKGGKHETSEGYIMTWCPGHPAAKQNYVLEHRLVMEKHIGRYLTKEEVVHHINEIKDDNCIDNLMLFPNNSAHTRFHKINT